MLRCEGLVKNYGNDTVIDYLSFRVEAGEIFGLIGPNGAGKTTTIKMILGLTEPAAGKIEIASDIKVGYSPETPHFYGFLTAEEVLRFYGKLEKIPNEELAREIEEILDIVGLADSAHKKVRNFSKGMIQRLALGQSLLGSPDLLILDEPAAGLDAQGRTRILELISRLKDDGMTIIINSHILHDVERIADRGIILKEGKMIREWDFNSRKYNIRIRCNYNQEILESIRIEVSTVKEVEQGLEVEVKDEEEIALIARLIIVGGGKLYRIEEGDKLERIFLESIGGGRQ